MQDTNDALRADKRHLWNNQKFGHNMMEKLNILNDISVNRFYKSDASFKGERFQDKIVPITSKLLTIDDVRQSQDDSLFDLKKSSIVDNPKDDLSV